MSLFIGGLSYSDPALMNEVRLGVLVASAISAVIGYGVLMAVSQKTEGEDEAEPAVAE